MTYFSQMLVEELVYSIFYSCSKHGGMVEKEIILFFLSEISIYLSKVFLLQINDFQMF